MENIPVELNSKEYSPLEIQNLHSIQLFKTKTDTINFIKYARLLHNFVSIYDIQVGHTYYMLDDVLSKNYRKVKITPNKLFEVEIKETLSRIVEVGAIDEDEAVQQVQNSYNNEYIVLDDDDICGAEFNIVNNTTK